MKLNTEKLRSALAQEKTVVHCDTFDKGEAIFEAMGWKRSLPLSQYWQEYGDKVCLGAHQGVDWCYGPYGFFKDNDYTILSLDDFILPDKPRLAEVLGVEVGQVFKVDLPGYPGLYRVNAEGCREAFIDSAWVEEHEEESLVAIINNPHLIRIVPQWSEDDVADAKAVRRLLPEYEWVARDKNRYLLAYREKPYRDKKGCGFYNSSGEMRKINSAAFPGVTWENSPVRIADITGEEP